MIEAFFFPFLDFYFPELSREIDHGKPARNLDTELRKLEKGNRSGGRYADLLYEVDRTDGQKQKLLCHIEIQGQKEEGFPRRLFQYGYRIMDREGRFPATLVVLTDSDPNFYPASYSINLGAGKSLSVDFHVSKLLYLKGKRNLEESRNPFSFVSAAHLNAMGQIESRECFRRKLDLSTRLLNRGFPEREVTALLRFLDWVFQLPRELELRYDDALKPLMGEECMPYVTHWERFAEERGLEQGLEQGITKGELLSKRRILIRQLEKKFGLEGAEGELIEACEDSALLDTALDTLVFAEKKASVLGKLEILPEAEGKAEG